MLPRVFNNSKGVNESHPLSVIVWNFFVTEYTCTCITKCQNIQASTLFAIYGCIGLSGDFLVQVLGVQWVGQ